MGYKPEIGDVVSSLDNYYAWKADWVVISIQDEDYCTTYHMPTEHVFHDTRSNVLIFEYKLTKLEKVLYDIPITISGEEI